MKPPAEFHSCDYQSRLLRCGTREQIIEWLVWNDPDGIYTDEDSRAEDMELLTLERARELMWEQTSRDRGIS